MYTFIFPFERFATVNKKDTVKIEAFYEVFVEVKKSHLSVSIELDSLILTTEETVPEETALHYQESFIDLFSSTEFQQKNVRPSLNKVLLKMAEAGHFKESQTSPSASIH